MPRCENTGNREAIGVHARMGYAKSQGPGYTPAQNAPRTGTVENDMHQRANEQSQLGKNAEYLREGHWRSQGKG